MIAVCCGCAALGPSESARALQTPVARQATQPAEVQQEAEAQPSPSGVPVATPGEILDSGPCELVAEGELTVYERPHLDAEVFGTMSAGFRVELEARTADGWWGFEPGVAQAANIGVFRLRWVHESSPIQLEGPCGDLQEVVGPPPGVCFHMPLEDVDVYAGPNLSSEVVASLTVGDYAAVVGTSNGWAKLDLAVGNIGQDIMGWIPAATLNMNGPCENLPAPEPS